MDLNPTLQERQFRDGLRAWLEAHAPRDWEARQSATDSMEARFAFLRDWQRQVYEGGWAGLSWSKEYGGRGATLMEKAIFTEEMAIEVGNRGIQVQGGMGFTWENSVHLYYKRAKASELMIGDATYHRERIAHLVIDKL